MDAKSMDAKSMDAKSMESFIYAIEEAVQVNGGWNRETMAAVNGVLEPLFLECTWVYNSDEEACPKLNYTKENAVLIATLEEAYYNIVAQRALTI